MARALVSQLSRRPRRLALQFSSASALESSDRSTRSTMRDAAKLALDFVAFPYHLARTVAAVGWWIGKALIVGGHDEDE